jgi:hypothetical protein
VVSKARPARDRPSAEAGISATGLAVMLLGLVVAAILTVAVALPWWSERRATGAAGRAAAPVPPASTVPAPTGPPTPTVPGSQVVSRPLAPDRLSASSSAPSGVDASGQPVTYEAGNLVDGQDDTAWRVAGGGVAVTLQAEWDAPVTLTSIGLLPGGTQLEQNVHALRANGIGLAVGIAGSLWGARGVTQAGQHAMAELWNIPGKNRPSFWTRQARGLALLLVFAVGLAATTLLTGLGSLGSHTAPFRLANLVLATGVNIALYLLAFRVLTPRQIPTRQLVVGSIVGGVAWQALLAAGGYLVGHNLKHASEVYGFFAVVLGLLSWLYLGAQLTLYAAEVNVVRARRLWPRSLLQPPLTQPDQRALVDLSKQEEPGPSNRSR